MRSASSTAPLPDEPDAIQIRHFVEPRVQRDSWVRIAIAASRVQLAAGDLDAAETSAFEALAYDRDSDEAMFQMQLVEEAIEARGDG